MTDENYIDYKIAKAIVEILEKAQKHVRELSEYHMRKLMLEREHAQLLKMKTLETGAPMPTW